jgi:hypothetical protein
LIFQIVWEELKMSSQSGKQTAPGEEDRARRARDSKGFDF